MKQQKRTTEELVSVKPSIEEFKSQPRNPVTVIVDDIRSLDNVGLLFRVSDGFLIRELILCGITGYPAGLKHDTRQTHTIERHDRRIKRTAIQTVPLVPWTYKESAVQAVQEQKEQGDYIVALEQTKGSVPYREAEYQKPMTLVVGHERHGVGDNVLKIADLVIEIPMLGYGNSHNVAVSTAIILSHLLT